MANEELCIRFSDYTYATKQEVSKALGISMVDDIWNRILQYRSTFYRRLSLRNIEKSPYLVTLTPTIGNRLIALERKFNKFILKYAKSTDSEEAKKLTEDHYIRILYWVAKKYNLSVDEPFLQSIIRHDVSTIAPDAILLIKYYEALEYVRDHYVDPIDETYIRKLYQILLEDNNDETIYRTNEFQDNSSKMIIGRIYNSAPSERISSMMNNLFDYIVHDEDVPFVKAVATYFFIYQVKPFDFFSEEIGVLLLKSILGHNDFDEVAAVLDFEQILSDNEEQVNKIINEVKKTNDLTYLLTYFLDLGETIANELLDLLQNVNVTSIRNEYYDSNPSVEVHTKYTPRENIVKDLNGPVSEEAAGQIDFEVSVALPTLPIGLEERDAVKIEEHLVEIYPTLKRGQAYFYARHCTIGKYYTIAQYKRLLGCAYETARTSMDNLVELGFYRKEKLNNKFIYTPVARK